MFTHDWIESLKDKADIIEIISKFFYLQKKGRNFWACCPFHGEKTPSFCVNAEQQFYKCFGCGEKGNVITFLRNYKKMSFTEALTWLATELNVPIPQQEETDEEKAFKAKLSSAYETLLDTAKFYRASLNSDKGKIALDYLKARNIDENTIRVFGLGYSPDFYTLPIHLKKLPHSEDIMIFSGVAERRNEKMQDFLGQRLIIPIINDKGKVIAFGGRLLEKKDFAKYKNTGATPIFDKKKNLYNINNLNKLRLEQSFDQIILVEGYMDVISLYQSEIKNVVASMGTSLTSEQCKLLKKYATKICVCFDGDAAGQMATLRSLDLLTAEGLDVTVISLPENMDPDDAVKKLGKDKFLKFVSNAKPLIDFKIFNISKQFDLNVLDNRSKFVQKALNVLLPLDPFNREIYIDLVAELSKLSKESIAESLKLKSLVSTNKVVKPKMTTSSEKVEDNDAKALTSDELRELLANRYILSCIVNSKNFANIKDVNGDFLKNNVHKAVFKFYDNSFKIGQEPKIGDLFYLEVDKEEIDLIIEDVCKTPKALEEKQYTDCMQVLFEARILARQTELINLIQQETDAEKRSQYTNELKQMKINK